MPMETAKVNERTEFGLVRGDSVRHYQIVVYVIIGTNLAA
jgi:hypothetical protein